MQHHVNVGAAIAGVYDLGRPDLQLGLQLIEPGHLPIAGCGTSDGIDLARRGVAEFRPVDMIFGNDAFESRANDFDWCRRKYIEVKVVTVDSLLEKLVEKLDVVFQANSLAHLVEVFATNAGTKLGIMQQQISQFSALLH